MFSLVSFGSLLWMTFILYAANGVEDAITTSTTPNGPGTNNDVVTASPTPNGPGTNNDVVTASPTPSGPGTNNDFVTASPTPNGPTTTSTPAPPPIPDYPDYPWPPPYQPTDYSTTVAPPVTAHFAIVATKSMRPGSIYNVAATCYNVDSNVDITVSLKGGDNKVLATESGVLTVGVTVIFSLAIPLHLPYTSYTLYASGTGGYDFNEAQTVTVKQKTLSIFIQSDKAAYKPGQKVLFRVIVVFPDLKPCSSYTDIIIYDSSANRIMQWLNQTSDIGVISQSLQLSDQPPLGFWQITASSEGNYVSSTFEVLQYVLPKFEVSIIAQSYYLINLNRQNLQTDFAVSVDAEYTYGQPVQGRASVSVQIQSYGMWDSGVYHVFMTDLELVNGKADLTLNITEIFTLLPVYSYYDYYTPNPWDMIGYRTIFVDANVTETVTGNVLSANTTVSCTTQKYQLQFLTVSSDNFKPGLTYTAYLSLTKYDGSLPDLADVTNAEGGFETINILATLNLPSQYGSFWYWDPVYTAPTTMQLTTVLDASGLATFSLPIDAKYDSVTFQATYFDNSTNNFAYAYKSINAFKSRDKQSIQVSFENPDGVIRSQELATFSVKTTVVIPGFQYQIMGKGIIQLSDDVMTNNSTNSSFSIWITKEQALTLAPSACVLVWYITDKGEIIADSTEISVAEEFINEVTLTFNANSTTPSQNVTLSVNAYSGSYVGLLAVDQSVILLRSGNDITRDKVEQDIRLYDNVNTPMQMDWVWPIFIDGTDTETLLHNIGVFLLTDGYFFSPPPPRPPPFFMAPTMAGMSEAPPPPPMTTVAMAPATTAGPGSSPTPSPVMSNPRFRFPETWLWTEVYAGSDGSVTFETSVPDTITSWIASAFALSKVAGLGIASSTTKLTVFKQFFISLNLPYSVIRGEEFALQVDVFNYLSIDLPVTVTVKCSHHYKIVGGRSKSVTVNSTSAASVYFWFIPLDLQQIQIQVIATSPLAGDAVSQTLLVEPEGVKQQYSTSTLIHVGSGSASNSQYSTTTSTPMPSGSTSNPQSSTTTFDSTFDITLPPAGILVPGSVYITVSVIGDVMGPGINGLGGLVQMPCGCGEQNMIYMAPDVYILLYLGITNKLTPDIQTTALNFINIGYQRELTYQRYDGSFSAFGNSDPAGSLWLSAFVIHVFHQAKAQVPVDDSTIANTISWMLTNQAQDGSFSEPPNGRVIHVDMQGQAGHGYALTAYTLIALVENQDNSRIDASSLQNSIANARTYLEDELTNIASDVYALAVTSYALAMSNSPRLSDAVNYLEQFQILQDGSLHWEEPPDSSDINQNSWVPPYIQARSANIELTSYILLTYCHLNDFSRSVAITKWIIAQQNSNGGFSSTQDTVMALKALSAFGLLFDATNGPNNLVVSVKTQNTTHSFLPITAETALLLQSYQLPSDTTAVDVFASGSGAAIFQLNVQYNVFQPSFQTNINMTINATPNENSLTVDICLSWTSTTLSGMVVMEVTLLTGFQASNLGDLQNQAQSLQRVDTSNNEIDLYFNALTSESTCITINMDKVFMVTNIKAAPVKVYPYYDPSSFCTKFYEAPGTLGQNSAANTCPACNIPA